MECGPAFGEVTLEVSFGLMAFRDLLLLSWRARALPGVQISGRIQIHEPYHRLCTREKNTLEMNKVKRQIPGRPRRSQSELDLQALGQRVRQMRGVDTQEEFARALNISQAQLSKYELGQSALPLSLVVKLAERSGRTTDWILTGKS